jgi:ribonuclease P protein subunit POP4
MENLLRRGLIGLEVRIVNSSNPSLLGVSGRVVDETKKTLVIESGGKAKVVPKSTSLFIITLPGGQEVEVEGGRILGRPEDRIKKVGWGAV